MSRNYWYIVGYDKTIRLRGSGDELSAAETKAVLAGATAHPTKKTTKKTGQGSFA